MVDIVTMEGKPFKPEEIEAKPILHRPSDILRTIAAEIDNGDFGDVTAAVVVVAGKELRVFGGGRDALSLYCVGLLQAGAHKLTKAIIE